MTAENWGASRPAQRGAALAIAVGLHLLLAVAWQVQRPVAGDHSVAVTYIDWVVTTPRAPSAPPSRLALPAPVSAQRVAPDKPAVHQAPQALTPRRSRADLPVTAAIADSPLPPAVADPAPADVPPVELAQPAAPAADVVSRARAMAGNIDQQIRREAGSSSRQAPLMVDSRHKQFLAKLEAATAKQWVGVPQVTEMPVPGNTGRMYKISNGNSSYCVRIPDANVGIDQYEWQRKNFRAITCPN